MRKSLVFPYQSLKKENVFYGQNREFWLQYHG